MREKLGNLLEDPSLKSFLELAGLWHYFYDAWQIIGKWGRKGIIGLEKPVRPQIGRFEDLTEIDTWQRTLQWMAREFIRLFSDPDISQIFQETEVKPLAFAEFLVKASFDGSSDGLMQRLIDIERKGLQEKKETLDIEDGLNIQDRLIRFGGRIQLLIKSCISGKTYVDGVEVKPVILPFKFLYLLRKEEENEL